MDRIDLILNSLESLESHLARKMSRWLTVNETAEYLKLSPRSIRRYLQDGIIPQHQLPTGTIRIERRDLDCLVLFGIPYRRLTNQQKKSINETQEF